MQSAPSQAGYYIFPDFAVCKPLLATRGITTGQQMCTLIMDEKKVAVSKISAYQSGLNKYPCSNLLSCSIPEIFFFQVVASWFGFFTWVERIYGSFVLCRL